MSIEVKLLAGSENVYPSYPVNVLLPGVNVIDNFDLRPEAAGPVSQVEAIPAEMPVPPCRIFSFILILTLSLLGFTVSILKGLWNVAPPILKYAFHSPVGLS